MKITFLLTLVVFIFGSTVLIAQTKSGKNSAKVVINDLIEQWHKAATKADAKTYFDIMDESCIFIGTDASEHWTKPEFYAFAKPYFDRGKAWDFKTINRNIFVAGKYAWFDELLDTWMGVCRSSGVLKKQGKNGWKIIHYQLSVTVPNDRIKLFLEVATKPDELNLEQK